MAKRLKKKYRILIPAVLLVIFAAALFVIFAVLPGNKYNHAVDLMKTGSYEEASEVLKELGAYKDSPNLLEECQKGIIYRQAVDHMDAGEYSAAAEQFKTIPGYQDSDSRAEDCSWHVFEDQYSVLLKEEKQTDALKLVQETQETAAGNRQTELDQKLNELASGFYEAGDYENALNALAAVSDPAKSSDLKQIIESEKADADRKNEEEKNYQELQDMVISDDETADRAEELISTLSEDYENAAEIQRLIEEFRPYLGEYQDPETGAVATVGISDGSLIIDADGTVTRFEYPYLSARAYVDDNNYTEYTIYSANTISVIALENGAVTRYSSFIR